MNNKFKFHPVGQGLFYTGQLANGAFNFVYDCGTSYSISGCKPALNKSINGFINELNESDKETNKKKIDFLVVSHLDADHIVGIYDLQKKGVRIEKIYLPYYPDKELLELTLRFELSIYEGEYSVEEVLLFWFRLYGISERNKEDSMVVVFCGNQEGEEELPLKEGEEKYIIKYKEIIECNWVFCMINKRLNNDEIAALKNKIDNLIGNDDIQDVFMDKKRTNELKKCYKNKNASSTVLVHYPKDTCNKLTVWEHNYSDDLRFTPGRKDGCLDNMYSVVTYLTGDIDFNNTLLKLFKEKILVENSIKIFQIPHHGSNSNGYWNKLDMQKFIFNYYIIPFGYGNRYGHPNYQIIDELQTLPADAPGDRNNTYKKVRFATQCDFFAYEIEL
jgi:hypothetical protein